MRWSPRCHLHQNDRRGWESYAEAYIEDQRELSEAIGIVVLGAAKHVGPDTDCKVRRVHLRKFTKQRVENDEN